jgi:cell division protein FtsB
VQQIHAVGCQAEETAAAQTIAQLQKQNADLKAQIQKLDPPKSGATKH